MTGATHDAAVGSPAPKMKNKATIDTVAGWEVLIRPVGLGVLLWFRRLVGGVRYV
jgi:hypothetical protein